MKSNKNCKKGFNENVNIEICLYMYSYKCCIMSVFCESYPLGVKVAPSTVQIDISIRCEKEV